MRRLLFPLLLFSSITSCNKPSEEIKFMSAIETSTCPKCQKKAGGSHVCGYTWLCYSCERDRGPGHICKKTSYCATCNRETGKNHDHGHTIICRTCSTPDEIIEFSSLNHQCDLNLTYCNKCKRDVGTGHSCLVSTYFCFECKCEVSPDVHIHGLSRFCHECKCERIIPDKGEHKCNKTRFSKPHAKEVPVFEFK